MKQSLAVLMRQLPPMRCDAGCTDCGGPALATEKEIRALRDYIDEQDIRPVRHAGLLCPFFQGGRCAVYPVRPWVCRRFGHSPDLVCSHGYNVNVDAKRERRMNRLYARQGQKRQLHAVFLGKAASVSMDLFA